MQELLASAVALHQAGQLTSAAALYETILAAEPDNSSTLHMLGVLRHQQGNHIRAIELIGRAIVLEPNAVVFHTNLAEPYRALGQFERAAGCCRMALRLWPDHADAFSNLGLALQGLGRTEEAAENLRRAIELQPDFATAHNNLGIVLRELGRLDEALDSFRRAVELSPDFAPAKTNLGQMLLDRGETEEALAQCAEAVRLQPNQAAMHNNLGNALAGRGETHRRPAAAYLEAILLGWASPGRGPRTIGGDPCNKNGNSTMLPWLQRAVELEPTSVKFQEFLALLHEAREEFAQAVVCWQRVVDMGKDPTRTRLALGGVLQEEGGVCKRPAISFKRPSGCHRIWPWAISAWADFTNSLARWSKPRCHSVPH